MTAQTEARLETPTPAAVARKIPEMIPLSKAARRVHVAGRVLRTWLEKDLGMVFESLGRGSSPLVRLTDVLLVIERRQAKKKYSPVPM